MSQFDDKNLTVGAFYWCVPTMDPDADEWWQTGLQPMRFAGYADHPKRGRVETWNAIGLGFVSDWPCTVMAECKPDQPGVSSWLKDDSQAPEWFKKHQR